MSDPQSERPDEAEDKAGEQSATLEDGPPSSSKPKPPAPPSGPMDIGAAQRACADEIHAACEKYGFRIFTRTTARDVAGGSILIDSTWGLAPTHQH
jgi:hypothetical protein